MKGMNEHTGRAVSGLDHLRQSIKRLFSTPIRSRVMRRDYGANIFGLIDHPGNELGLAKMRAAGIIALVRHEQRIIPTRLQIYAGDEPGRFVADLAGVAVSGIDEIAPGESIALQVSFEV
ncbi:MAG: GPW/gp25 family protein [Gammaproteobacteria bacterium]|nr:GPW/gp25 family protein [Gammaproteobacteria bacterium]